MKIFIILLSFFSVELALAGVTKCFLHKTVEAPGYSSSGPVDGAAMLLRNEGSTILLKTVDNVAYRLIYDTREINAGGKPGVLYVSAKPGGVSSARQWVPVGSIEASRFGIGGPSRLESETYEPQRETTGQDKDTRVIMKAVCQRITDQDALIEAYNAAKMKSEF